MLSLPDHEREAFWAGDDTVLNRYEARDGHEAEPGTILTIVISLHPASRQEWLTTRDMDEDDIEAHEQRIIREEERREWESRTEKERPEMQAMNTEGVRYDYSGYPIGDDCVLND